MVCMVITFLIVLGIVLLSVLIIVIPDLSKAKKRKEDSNINLTNADLRCANLIEVNLSYVILTDTNLSQASLQGIRGLEMYSIDNIGSFKGKVTYLPKYNKVFVGCWEGNLEEFLKKGLEMNERDNKERTNIVLAYQFFKNQL